jgi:DNA-binding LacI/PurR family transcriptional regulator
MKATAQRPTIRTVAEDAGVSRSAVSKVLCNAYGVSPELRARVMASIERLDYRPQTSARAMRGRTDTWGVLASEIHNPFFADVLAGIGAKLVGTAYKPFLGVSQSSHENEASLAEAMLDRQVDGLIWIAPRVTSAVLHRMARSVPMVVVSYHESSATDFDTANVDDEKATGLAVKHLHSMGLKKITMISVNWPEKDGAVPRLREEGYRNAMRDLGLNEYANVAYSEESAIDVGPITSRLLSEPDRPEAIICWNDFAALQVLSEAKRIGVDVPGDLAVVGFDNTAFCRLEQNALSSIDQFAEALGANAATMLLERLEGRANAKHVVLEPELHVRRSSSK